MQLKHFFQSIFYLSGCHTVRLIDIPVMKGRNSFFKLYHLWPFITRVAWWSVMQWILYTLDMEGSSAEQTNSIIHNKDNGQTEYSWQYLIIHIYANVQTKYVYKFTSQQLALCCKKSYVDR